MKEYIKPQVELMKYSFDDIIALGSFDSPESPLPDLGGDDENLDDF